MPKWFSGILVILFIIFPNEVKQGVKLGLDNSFLLLVPSLFPYMIISQCFVLTGGARAVANFLYKPVNWVTGFTKKGAEIYLLSLFCGYPTGARLASIACNNDEIDKKETLKLFAAANIPGFGFSVLFLGGAIFKSTALGIKIYISFVIASVFFSFLLSHFFQSKELKTQKEEDMNFQNAIVKSVLDSSQSMIGIISFVCFFSSIIKILGVFIKNELMLAVFAAFTEITSGIPLIVSKIPSPQLAVVFFTAFSGLSIIFQSMAFQKKNHINIFIFLFLRLIFGIIATVMFYIFSF